MGYLANERGNGVSGAPRIGGQRRPGTIMQHQGQARGQQLRGR